MNYLEKIIFLEITNKQFKNFPNSEYYSVYKKLNPEEIEEHSALTREIHDIWNYVNSMPVENAIDNRNINSIQDFHDEVAPVSELILSISNDFNLTLKDEITTEFKDLVIKTLGLDFYNSHFEKK